MTYVANRKLLKNRRVVDEIERYRWIESEKCGYDIGFNKAADHWIVYYAMAWLKYHSPATKNYTLRSDVGRSQRIKKLQSQIS